MNRVIINLEGVDIAISNISKTIVEYLKDIKPVTENMTNISKYRTGYFLIKCFKNGCCRNVSVYKKFINKSKKQIYVVYCTYEDFSYAFKYTNNLSIKSLENVLQEFYDEPEIIHNGGDQIEKECYDKIKESYELPFRN